MEAISSAYCRCHFHPLTSSFVAEGLDLRDGKTEVHSSRTTQKSASDSGYCEEILERESGISMEHFVGQQADVGCKGVRDAEMLSRDM